MARVVQQRKAPPYALIIFVFLFLVATTLAVYLHIERDKATQAWEEAERQNEKLASPTELKRPKIAELISKYDKKVREGKTRETVVGQLVMQVDQLTQKINGVVTTPEDAILKTDDLCKEINSFSGLIEIVRSAYKQRDDKETEANGFKAERNDAQDARDAAKASREQIATQYEKSKVESNEQLTLLKEKLGKLTKAHTDLLAEAKTAWQGIRQEKDKKIAEGADKLAAADTKMQELEQTLAVVRKKMAEIRVRIEAVTQPDGKILSRAEGGICFIDLGSQDGVEVGFTFAVYPQTGIPKDGVNKGSIVITSVGRDVSRCRVAREDNMSPVISDDLVANVAFDSVRKWRFVIEGNFDLHGTDEPDPEGAVEAKLLLRRLGATIADKVDVGVDFVVMGEEPTVPARPEQDAPPQVWEVWRLAVKVQKRYSQVRKLAKDLGVPIRNTNWLMDMTGYTPIKALRDVARP